MTLQCCNSNLGHKKRVVFPEGFKSKTLRFELPALPITPPSPAHPFLVSQLPLAADSCVQTSEAAHFFHGQVAPICSMPLSLGATDCGLLLADQRTLIYVLNQLVQVLSKSASFATGRPAQNMVMGRRAGRKPAESKLMSQEALQASNQHYCPLSAVFGLH